VKTGAIALVLPGLMAGWQADKIVVNSEICSLDHTRSICMNALGVDTHIYTHMHINIANKSNFKKPVACWPLASMQLV